MQAGGYFASEEAEKAAKWEIVEQYRKAKERLSVLDNRCHQVGGMVTLLGNALLNTPGDIVIVGEDMTLPKYAGAPAYAVERNRAERLIIRHSNFNMETIKALVDDYRDTQRIKTEALTKLREMGIDPEPKA